MKAHFHLHSASLRASGGLAPVAIGLLILVLSAFVLTGTRLAGAALVFLGLLLAVYPRRASLPRTLGIGTLVASLGAAASHRLLLPGFGAGHDFAAHAWGLYGLHRSVEAGDLFPIWIHQIGAGIPLFLFYPPLPHRTVLPLVWTGMGIHDALRCGFVLFSVASAGSMYWVARRFTGDGTGAVIAAAAYAFAPYRLLQGHYRMALAESASMVVLPPFLWALRCAVRAPSGRRMAVAAGWTALLVLTHPLTLLMAGWGGAAWMTIEWLGARRRGLSALALVGALALGAGLAAFYLLPAIVEAPYTTIERSLRTASGGGLLYERHGLRPHQLVERRPWDRLLRSGLTEGGTAGRRCRSTSVARSHS